MYKGYYDKEGFGKEEVFITYIILKLMLMALVLKGFKLCRKTQKPEPPHLVPGPGPGEIRLSLRDCSPAHKDETKT